MADQITYPNKVTGDQFLAPEATELKTVVNTNATELTTATANISTNAGNIASNTAQFSDLDEQAVLSNLVEADISGTYELDLAVSRMWLLTLTANTTISVSNLAASTCAAFTVKLTGNFVPTLTGVNVYGDSYDGTIQNLLSFNAYNTALDVPAIDVIITNLA